jgi:hypothetical protein
MAFGPRASAAVAATFDRRLGIRGKAHGRKGAVCDYRLH